jgi:hypothetical protein
MQQAYPESGDATNPVAAPRPIAVRPPEANLGFTRFVDVGICSLETSDVRCRIRVAAGRRQAAML